MKSAACTGFCQAGCFFVNCDFENKSGGPKSIPDKKADIAKYNDTSYNNLETSEIVSEVT